MSCSSFTLAAIRSTLGREAADRAAAAIARNDSGEETTTGGFTRRVFVDPLDVALDTLGGEERFAARSTIWRMAAAAEAADYGAQRTVFQMAANAAIQAGDDVSTWRAAVQAAYSLTEFPATSCANDPARVERADRVKAAHDALVWVIATAADALPGQALRFTAQGRLPRTVVDLETPPAVVSKGLRTGGTSYFTAPAPGAIARLRRGSPEQPSAWVFVAL